MGSGSEFPREKDVKRSASVFPASLGGWGGKNLCCANFTPWRGLSLVGTVIFASSVLSSRTLLVILLKKFSLVSCEDTRSLG